jgi:glycerol-3-phosphate dehydrogenase
MTDRLDLYRTLQAFYGPRSGQAFDFITSDERYQRPVLDSSPVLLGQLAYALAHEDALTLEDLLYRRTRLVWQPDLTAEAAQEIVSRLESYFPDRLEHGRADALREPPAWRRRAAPEKEAPSPPG